jgi:hypothetical protein
LDDKNLDCFKICNSSYPIRYIKPHPYDNRKYIICDGGKGKVECCCRGLVFNPHKLTCRSHDCN